MRRRFLSADAVAVVLLVALWALFFWRLLTPNTADQASLVNGDFSGQFVAFGAYQYERLTAGEVPLWNPYNNGGLPFIADTQAAVFYPPRLLTIALSAISGGWTYHALELEMIVHVLLYSLLMYALVRYLTASVYGGFIAALIAAYGGFMAGYPQLQLALLEASTWLPLAALGICAATATSTAETRLGFKSVRWGWLLVSGFALGMSWMAGHPQTSWLLTYFMMAYLAYRVYAQRYRWQVFVVGTALFGAIAGGMAAVQLLPTFEYIGRTARTEFTFDAKGGGFPFYDVLQMLFPGTVSTWSPLYVGLGGLALAYMGLWRGTRSQSVFWGMVALVALLAGFGAHTPLYPALYNILPGANVFRGQERAAFLFANSLAILAGIGAASLTNHPHAERIRRILLVILAAILTMTGLIFVLWLGSSDAYSELSILARAALIAVPSYLLLSRALQGHQRVVYGLLAAVLVFDLFAVNMDTRSVFAPVPPTQQLSFTPPPFVARVLEDGDTPFRVDGNYRDLYGNYGTLYSVMDIRGISPLFLEGPHTIIQTNQPVNPLAWEIFAVRYVFTDWNELPVPSEIVMSGQDRFGTANLHQLSNPRPFAWLVYNVALVGSDDEANALLADANFNARETVILNREPNVAVSGSRPADTSAEVTTFAPEHFTIEINTPQDALLTIAHPDYPGWRATIDGQPAEIMRAYGATVALPIRAGQHMVEFFYEPLTYRVGSIISLLTWSALVILGVISLVRGRHVFK